ncbi:MAG: PilN domain-containing protein [Candidatus Edwardsbacteria bacterium]
MIDIDLLRERKKVKVPIGIRPPKAKKKITFALPKIPFHLGMVIALVVFALVLVIVVMTYLSQQTTRANLRKKLESERKELASLQEAKKLVENYKKMQEEVKKKLGVIENLDRNRFYEAHILDEIISCLSEHLWLTSLTENNGALSLEGITFSKLIVADFMDRLEESPWFSNVELSVLQKGEVEGREVEKFVITASVTIPPATPSAITPVAQKQ